MARIVIFQILVLTRISEGAAKRKNCRRGEGPFQSQTGQALGRWNTPEGGQKYYLFTQWQELLLLRLLIICVRQRMCLHCESKLDSTFMTFHFGHAYCFYEHCATGRLRTITNITIRPMLLGRSYIVFIRPLSRKLTRLMLSSNQWNYPYSAKKDLSRLLQLLRY